MIETVGGAAQAREIAAIPGVDTVFAASSDLGNFSGYKQGDPDYERLINVVHDAARASGKRLCGPFAWLDPPDLTCFQAATETVAIFRRVAAELGDLKDTQGKPEVGPYAPKKWSASRGSVRFPALFINWFFAARDGSQTLPSAISTVPAILWHRRCTVGVELLLRRVI